MAGTRITVDIEDKRTVAALRRLVGGLADPAPALDAIGARLVTSTVLRFERETAPDGTPWKQSRRAAKRGGQTLTHTARLRQSITHRVDNDAVLVGTNVVYGVYHQLGTRTAPARPFLGLDDGDTRAIERIVRRFVDEALT